MDPAQRLDDTRGQGAFAVGALVVACPKPAAGRKVLSGQTAKMLTDRPHDGLVSSRQAQPGADAGPIGWGDHKRGSDRTHQPAT
jgi:hypothetical protein